MQWSKRDILPLFPLVFQNTFKIELANPAARASFPHNPPNICARELKCIREKMQSQIKILKKKMKKKRATPRAFLRFG